MFKIPTFEFKLASNVACMEKIASLLSFTIFSLMEATIYIIYSQSFVPLLIMLTMKMITWPPWS